MDFFEDSESLADALATKEVLVDTEGRIGMILNLLPVGLLIHQPQGILFSNQAACELLGQSPEALIGQHFLDHIGEEQSPELSKCLHEAFESDRVIQRNEVALAREGYTTKIMAVTIAKLPWAGTSVVQILLDDITLQVERERRLQIMLSTDTLTGSQNRRSLIKYVQTLKASNHNGTCGVLLWDIDFFKNINDTYGHQAGDTALRSLVLEAEYKLAERILVSRPNLPRPMLARFGGEEFAVIIPETDAAETLAYAEKIRAAIAKHTIHSQKYAFSVTVSIGIAMGTLAEDSVDSLLNLADKALYAAKENGRDQTMMANSSLPIPPETKRVSRNSCRN